MVISATLARDLEEQRASIVDCFTGAKRDIARDILLHVDNDDMRTARAILKRARMHRI